MIRPSPEIEAIVRRWTTLIRTHKVTDLPHFLSRDAALIYIGTSDGELWKGQLVRDGIADHMAEVPDFTENDVEIEAWENGETGWAVYRSRFHFADTGAEGVHRATFVFVMEQGGWKMIQHHISQPDSNIEKMGVEHAAFADLIAAARDGFALNQREGMATVMFTDVADSSSLAEMMGDRTWAAIIASHFATVRQHVEAQGGQLVKSLGDGTMSSFPTAQGALVAAQGIVAHLAAQTEEPRLRLRMGLHTGKVIQTDDDFFGTVVNKAARIAAAAAPGEVLVSDATRLMVGTGVFDFGPAQAIALKGLSGDHALHRLMA